MEFVFLRKNKKYCPSLETFLGCILDKFGFPAVDIRKVRKYASLSTMSQSTGKAVEMLFDNYQEAEQHSLQLFSNGKKVQNRYEWSEVERLPVTLLCHTGLVDISNFNQSGKWNCNLWKHCSYVNGGLISLHPIPVLADSLLAKYLENNNPAKYPVRLYIADTMCHAPEKKRKLSDLGKTVGYEKIVLSEEEKKHMDRLLASDPVTYFEYASTDSVVTLLYAAGLYGYNHRTPVTITSISAKVIRELMKKYLCCENDTAFDRKFRGLETIGHGKVKKENKAGFVVNTSLEPISNDADVIQRFSSLAYHGGYNGCFEVGYFTEKTYEFPKNVRYPCIPIDMVKGEDFSVSTVVRKVSMDFDMKRKPEERSFFPKLVEWQEEFYEIACFSTVPFETIEEFQFYRKVKESCRCLRTMSDWEYFWNKLTIKDGNSKAKPRDMEWAILNSCITGHRAGLWNIPMLDKLKGKARNDWIDSHNTSGKKYKDSDWKNAGLKSRQASILPREMLTEKLEELIKEK